MSQNREENISLSKEEKIIFYAANAALNTKGVADLIGGITDTISKTVLGKDTLSKGIKLTNGEEGVVLDIYIKVNFGAKIPSVAWDLQRNVKKEVEKNTEISVKSVNIHVQGVEAKELIGEL